MTSPLKAGSDQAYIDALLAYLGERDPLVVFAETPGKLIELVNNAPKDLLRVAQAEGKWSMFDVCLHFAQVELVLGFRYRCLIAEDGPPIQSIDQDKWISNLYPESYTIENVLDEFKSLRAINLHLLKQVEGETWQKFAVHSDRGNETLESMTRLYAAHDLYHLEQFQRIQNDVSK